MSSQIVRAWQVGLNGRDTLVQVQHDPAADRLEILVAGFASPFRRLGGTDIRRFELFVRGRAGQVTINTAGDTPTYDLSIEGAGITVTPVAVAANEETGPEPAEKKSFWQSLFGKRAASAS